MRLWEPFDRRNNVRLSTVKHMKDGWMDWGRRLISLSNKFLRGVLSIRPSGSTSPEDISEVSQGEKAWFIFNWNVNRVMWPYVSLILIWTPIFIYLPLFIWYFFCACNSFNILHNLLALLSRSFSTGFLGFELVYGSYSCQDWIWLFQ